MITGIDLLKEYDRGQALRAADVNAFIATARRVNKFFGSSIGDADCLATWMESTTVSERQNVGQYAKNNSGEAIPPGAVMRRTDVVVIEDEQGWKIGKPNKGYPYPMLVADIRGASMADAGFIHCAWAFRPVWCLYTGYAPTINERWGTEDGSWSLAKGKYADFVALGPTLTIGESTYGLFIQPLNQPLMAVTNGSLSHGGSCTVERIRRKSGGSPAWERTGNTFTAYDVYLNTGESADSGTICRVQDYGVPTIDSLYCASNDWLD